MNFWGDSFRKSSFAKNATAAGSLIAVFGGVSYAVAVIASTDTVQKIHIRHKLLNTTFPKPPHMDKVVHHIYFKKI
jgi:acyl-CoA thioesterase